MKLDSIDDWVRTCYSANVTPFMDGKEVTFFGWVQEIRDLGGLRFVILQDKKGQIQVTIHKNKVPADVVKKAKSLELDVQMNYGTDKTVVALLGSNTGQIPTDIFAVLPGVASVTRIMKPYKLASRDFRAKNTKVKCGDVEIGGERIIVIAGPCAVENETQLKNAAKAVKKELKQ